MCIVHCLECCSVEAAALRMLHFIWSGGIELGPDVNLSWLLTNVFTSLVGRPPAPPATVDDDVELDLHVSSTFILAAISSDSSDQHQQYR